MKIMTYNEILIFLADEFDAFLAEKTNLRLERSNTNTIYLLLKAIAKGFEVVNNTVYSLSAKFDPERCDASDLDSSARLVGTVRKSGKQSGLRIDILNTSTTLSQTLLPGTYEFTLETGSVFNLVIGEPLVIGIGEVETVAALSTEIGSFYTTDVEDAPFVGLDGVVIPQDLQFNIKDNSFLLGSLEESDNDFRLRILQESNRRNALTTIKTELEDLPTIFNAYVEYNNTQESIVVGGRTVPKGYLIVFINGSVTEEVAKIVAANSYFPTSLLVGTSKTVSFEDPIFASNEYVMNYFDFNTKEYSVSLTVSFDESLTTEEEVQSAINSSLLSFKSQDASTRNITEADFYLYLNEVSIPSLRILTLQFKSSTGENISLISSEKGTLVSLKEVVISKVE